MKIPVPEFFRFCIVGGGLFVCDALMLELLVHLGFSAFTARLISLGIALQLAYIAHGFFTFKGHAGFNRRSWLGFLAANALGACINYLVFTCTLALMEGADNSGTRIFAIAIGTIIALFFNYWMNRRYVFKRKDS